jgi:hypothetical protein
MIIIKMVGGLANKMFQFALYFSLEKTGKSVFIDNRSFIPTWNFENIDLLDIFPNVQYQHALNVDVERLSGSQNIIGRIRRKIPILWKPTYIREMDLKFNPSILLLEGDYYLEGLWQTEKLFVNIKTEIQNAFIFKKFVDMRNIELSEKLSHEESVSIHIRKGADYNKEITKGTCEPNYYQNAFQYIIGHIKNPKFYVFTDNKQWVERNIHNIEYTLIDWNPISGVDNYIDMQLMTYCKHNIIANSTYSWWGAWLNHNPQKIVIGPQKWYNRINVKDILPDEWIKV